MKSIALAILLFTYSSIFSQENKYPLDPVYHTPYEILQDFKNLKEKYPDIFMWEIIGNSSNDSLPLYAVKISDNVRLNEHNEAAVLICGQHHSEEPIGVEVGFHIINQLLKNYSKSSEIKKMINNFEIWFVPTVNPEGFSIVKSGKYPLKRKNSTDTNYDGISDIKNDGVDLNKNYPCNWEEDYVDDQFSQYYKGPYPASESEIRTMIDFYKREMFQLAIFYHSSANGTYNEKIFFPWKADKKQSDNYNDLSFLASILAAELPRDYDSGNYVSHLWNNFSKGYARDYIYSELGCLPLNVEIGGINDKGISVIFPAKDKLREIEEKHYKAFIKLMAVYHENLIRGRIVGLYSQPIVKEPIFFAEEPLLKRKPITSNETGYFFRFVTPEKKLVSLICRNKYFELRKKEANTIKISTTNNYIDRELFPIFYEGEVFTVDYPDFSNKKVRYDADVYENFMPIKKFTGKSKLELINDSVVRKGKIKLKVSNSKKR